MITQNTVLRLKATAAAAPSKVLKLRLVKKEDANYKLPKESFYYKEEKLATIVNTLDMLIARAKKRLAALEMPSRNFKYEHDDEEFKRRLRTIQSRYEDSGEEMTAELAHQIFTNVKNQMDKEVDEKEDRAERRYFAEKKALEEYIITREKNFEHINNLHTKELRRILDILESMSDEESEALRKKEGDMSLKLEMKKQAMKLLTLEEKISLMQKETKEFMKEGFK